MRKTQETRNVHKIKVIIVNIQYTNYITRELEVVVPLKLINLIRIVEEVCYQDGDICLN
jgi:hypothetical protein